MRKNYTIEELSVLLNITDDEIYSFMNSGQLCYSRGRGFEISFSQRCVNAFIPVLEKYHIEKKIERITIDKLMDAQGMIKEKFSETPTAKLEKILSLDDKEIEKPLPEVKPVEIKPIPSLEKAIRNEEPEVIEEPKVIACQGEHEVYTPATYTVGVKNQWHLCDACAGLPKYKKYKKRVRIEL